ncbi:MAG TPA: adenylosuccinate synthase [Planctomycetota bacterium]|nr:adenylosuccinate synthase [Planctomycetota bacterium]
MPSLCLFGAQWGDEGKGKVIDHLAGDADYVVRYQGGSNAGHTVVVGGQKYVLHLIPSGVLHPGKVNVIGNGVALDPILLLEEIDGLRARGVAVDGTNLRVSARAHVIFEHHRGLDLLAERARSDARKIGTTGRGIGPCYADKAARVGLRIADLLDDANCREMLRVVLEEKNLVRERLHGAEPLDLAEQIERYSALGLALRPYVGDTGREVRRAHAAGKVILFEAAQGAMLDVDHGTYPFVTSSSTGVDGIAAGVGFPPQQLGRALGIAKAYCTRVGAGPFPSEDTGEDGVRLRKQGNEYGATTGRPRRCGWIDLVALRYALELNGAAGWVLTNLDVLGGFERIKVGVAYRLRGQRLTEFPADLADLADVEVVYEELPGWPEDISGVRHYADLPRATREYVEHLEELSACPVQLLSVGAARDEVVPRGL